jgi:phenylpyruvate tautomerase PptA (4-oxalocrotonate tautomerase family)
MPFIDCKLTKIITEEQKDKLKAELGKAIATMNKTESYLMVGISDGYDLYFGGKKLENGAYVAVNVFGEVNPVCSEKMTKVVCDILFSLFGTKGRDIYVTYQGISDWGWNGVNF